MKQPLAVLREEDPIIMPLGKNLWELKPDERSRPQCLLGDVGGTNIRLTLVPAVRLSCRNILPPATHRERYRTGDFAHLREALARFVREKPDDVGSIVTCALSVCGPVSNDGKAICLAESMGSDGWTLEPSDLAAALGLGAGRRLHLLNDFVAVGLAVGGVDWRDAPHDLITVHAGTPHRQGTIAVLGPGTGLGSCFGVWPSPPALRDPPPTELQIFPSEGGESDFVARTADEWALREYLARTLEVEHVKVEHVVSGLGLSRIYQFLRARARDGGSGAVRGGAAGGSRKRKGVADASSDDAAAAVEAAVLAATDPSAVVARHGTPGEAGADAHCIAALDMFIDALGAEAANLALRFQAHGGVYIAGGVAAKLASRLTRAAEGGTDAGGNGRLQAAYLGKGRSTPAYSACPLYVCAVDGDDLALEGVWQFALSDKCCFRHLQG